MDDIRHDPTGYCGICAEFANETCTLHSSGVAFHDWFDEVGVGRILAGTGDSQGRIAEW